MYVNCCDVLAVTRSKFARFIGDIRLGFVQTIHPSATTYPPTAAEKRLGAQGEVEVTSEQRTLFLVPFVRERDKLFLLVRVPLEMRRG